MTARNEISVRLSLEDAEKIRTALERLGTTGKAALEKIDQVKTDRARAQVDQLAQRLDPAERAAAALARQTALLNKSFADGAIPAERHAKVLADAKANYDRLIVAANQNVAAQGAVAKSAETAARGVGSSRAAVQNLSYQLQDSIVQLQGGADAMLVLSQQGSQAAMSMGRFGAQAGLVIAVAGAALAALSKLAGGAREVDVALKASGNQAGLTRGQIEAVARETADLGQITAGSARSIQTSLVRMGGLSGPVIRDLTKNAADLAAMLGTDAAEAAKKLGEDLREPAKAAEEYGKSLGVLSDSQIRDIRNLQEQGRLTEAQTKLLAALNERARGLADQGLSAMTRAWRGISNAVSNYIDNLTKAQTEEDKLAAARRAREQAEASQPTPTGRGQAQQAAPEAPRSQTFGPSSGAGQRAKSLEDLRLEEIARAQAIVFAENEATADTIARTNQRLINSANVKARSLDPNADQRSALQNTITELQNILKEGIGPVDQYRSALERAQGAMAGLKSETERAVDQQKIEAQVLKAAPADRERLRAQLQAEYEAKHSARDAAERKAFVDAKLAEVDLRLADASDQLTQKVRDEAAASSALASAHDAGAVAVARQQAANEAHAAALTGATQNEKAYAQAILARNAAQQEASLAGSVQSLEFDVEGAQRLAEAAKQGAAAQQEVQRQLEVERATRAALIAAEASGDKERIERVKALVGQYGQLTEEMAAAARSSQLSAQLDQQRESIVLLQREGELIGALPEVRARELAITQAILQAQRTYGENLEKLPEAERARLEQVIATSGAIAEQAVQMQEIERIGGQASDAIVDDLTDMATGGKGAFKSLKDFAVSSFKQIVAEYAKPILIRFAAQVMGVSGAAGGATGIAGTAAGVGGAGGSSSLVSDAGTALAAADKLTGGTIMKGITGYLDNVIGPSIGLASSVGPSSAAALTSTATGPGGMLVGGGVTSSAGTMAPGIAGSTTLSGVLSGAGWGVIGSLAANALGLGSRNPYINAAGGALGAVGGAYAGATIGSAFPVVGTAIGAVLGAFLGTVASGLFGGKEKRPPNPYARTDIQGGRVVLLQTESQGGDLRDEVIDPLADAARNLQLVAAAGQGLDPARLALTQIGYSTNKREKVGSGFFVATGGEPGNVTGLQMFPSAEEDSGKAATDAVIAAVKLGFRDEDVAKEMSASLKHVFELPFKDLEEFGKALDFVPLYDALISIQSPAEQAGEAIAQTKIVMDALRKTYEDATAEATKLGLATDILAENQAKAEAIVKGRFADTLDDAILTFTDPMQLAMRQLDREIETLKKEAAVFEDDSLISKIDEIRRLRAEQIDEEFKGTKELAAAAAELAAQARQVNDALAVRLATAEGRDRDATFLQYEIRAVEEWHEAVRNGSVDLALLGKVQQLERLAIEREFADRETEIARAAAEEQIRIAEEQARAAADLARVMNDVVLSARNDYIGALQREAGELEATAQRWRGFAGSLGQFRQSLLLGPLSPLSPEQRYNEAQSQFEDIARRARLGDMDAIGQLEGASQAYLQANQDYWASSNPLAFQKVQDALRDTESVAERQARIADEQLSVAQQQLTALGVISRETMTAADALARLTTIQGLVNQPREWGANPGLNVQLAAATGYGGAFGGGGFDSWIRQQSESVKAVARGLVSSAGIIPGFATGGSFTIGGSGGPDSQFVPFWGSPGEMVDVKTPYQASSQNREVERRLDGTNARLDRLAGILERMLGVTAKAGDGTFTRLDRIAALAEDQGARGGLASREA